MPINLKQVDPASAVKPGSGYSSLVAGDDGKLYVVSPAGVITPVGAGDGVAGTIAVKSVTTGNPGTNASVVNSGTASAAQLDFTIPRGADGDKWTFGSGAPASGWGVPGQNYIDYTTWTVYNKSNSTTWSSLGTLKPATSNMLLLQDGQKVTKDASQGTATDLVLLDLLIPANTMGPQGVLEFLPLWSLEDTANSKTITITLGGVTLWTSGATSGSTIYQNYVIMRNRNNQKSQVAYNPNVSTPFQSSGPQVPITSAIDFTVDQHLICKVNFAAGGTASTKANLEGWHLRVSNL